ERAETGQQLDTMHEQLKAEMKGVIEEIVKTSVDKLTDQQVEDKVGDVVKHQAVGQLEKRMHTALDDALEKILAQVKKDMQPIQEELRELKKAKPGGLDKHIVTKSIVGSLVGDPVADLDLLVTCYLIYLRLNVQPIAPANSLRARAQHSPASSDG
ncbi:hypothetical protein HaLaN_04376, partial [Haematococcus lacustris]